MLDTKKTLKSNTFVFFICIIIVAAFSVGPFIENELATELHIVTFDYGDDKTSTISVLHETTAIKPKDPIREGYIFEGWYLDQQEYDFNNLVREDIVLKAIWKKDERTHYTVKFDVKGGTLIDSQTIKKGEKVVKPVNPTRAGYIFIEWRYNNVVFDFSTPIEDDVTLVAIWKEK